MSGNTPGTPHEEYVSYDTMYSEDGGGVNSYTPEDGPPIGLVNDFNQNDQFAILLDFSFDNWIIARGNDAAAVIAQAEKFRDALNSAIERIRASAP